MDAKSYALSKQYTNLVAIGLASASVDDVNKSITFTLAADGSQHTIHFSQPSDGQDGISVTGVSDKGNGIFTLLFSNGSESDPIQTIKGQKGADGFSPTITENADNTDKIYRLDITTADTTFTTPNLKGADGQGGSGGSGEENVIESIKVNGVAQTVAADKSVDITVPSIEGLTKDADLATVAKSGDYEDLINKPTIPESYDDTEVKSQIQAVASGLMDSAGYSADYKTIDIVAKNGNKKSINVAPIIEHASITELSDVDTTNKANGKALVYNAVTSKHEYADVSGTDEKVKMDASSDSKYLGELLDNVTIANENGELKVKKLDGQEVTITEINYLKGLTMNVMDLVNMFSNGGVKIINTPVATYAELLTIDKSAFIEGISYLVYVLADENHDNAKTTYLVDKDSETPTYFGFADSNRDFVTNPIDLATEITGKLGISNMDSDAIKALFTVDDTYKIETATNNAFSTHGAKALYDELFLAIGGKANDSDLTTHKDDANIHVSTEDRTKWNRVTDKVNIVDITDNVTSADTDKPLSANQGRLLNENKMDKIVSITQAEYDSNKEHYDSLDAIVEITDSNKNGGDASNVRYGNTDVASALDSINNNLQNKIYGKNLGSSISNYSSLTELINDMDVGSIVLGYTTSGTREDALSIGLIPTSSNYTIRIEKYTVDWAQIEALYSSLTTTSIYRKTLISGNDRGWYSITATKV